MSYTDAELEAMMVDLESDLVERKESAQDGSKIRRNICAFANDLPRNSKPGVLFIGVRDNGSCASLQVDDAMLTRLANIPGEGQILPLPSMTVQKRILRGCEVAVVAVAPSSEPPVRFRGRVWVRVGPSPPEKAGPSCPPSATLSTTSPATPCPPIRDATAEAAVCSSAWNQSSKIA